MPNFISVVVPAYGVQGYLNECLDSVRRRQDTGAREVDVEVFGVDDASPDHCGVILDERANRDPHLTACNPAAVYERAKEQAPDVRGVWIVNRGRAASVPAGVDVVIAGALAYYRAIARARWLVNNATFPPEVNAERLRRAELGIAPGERVVVYAPTHREWHATFTPVLDVDELAEALGPDTRILPRGHYFYPGAGLPPKHPRVTDVSGHPSVETLYLAADALIFDYSSVMFDYAVLDKPLVIFAPNWEIYRAVRGVTFDLAAEPPGVFARTVEELVDAFRSGEVADDRSAKARQHFRERFCSLDDGHAAERVVRRVFLGEPLRATADRKVHMDA